MLKILVAPLLVLAAALAGCTESGGAPNCAELLEKANGTNPNHTKVEITTNKGVMKIELLDDASPITAKNFKRYVDEKFYDNVVFHRIVKGFMMQGGKFNNTTKALQPGQHEPIELEATKSGCLNKHYTLSMARQGGSNTKTATTEFFVNFKANTNLDPSGEGTGYAVFGIVYDGQAVVDLIEKTPVHTIRQDDKMCQQEDQRNTVANCPDSPVEMISAKVT